MSAQEHLTDWIRWARPTLVLKLAPVDNTERRLGQSLHVSTSAQFLAKGQKDVRRTVRSAIADRAEQGIGPVETDRSAELWTFRA
jgi:hypothetical protein